MSEVKEYAAIRQGTALNTLTKIRPTEKNIKRSVFLSMDSIVKDGLTLSTKDYNQKLDGLRTSAYKLLDAISATFTESGGLSRHVILPLDEYMRLCGLKDKKEARKQVKADLDALFGISLSFKGKSKREKSFLDVWLCDAKGIKNSIIMFSFSPTFYEIIAEYPLMPYPAQIWKLDAHKNPNSFYLLRKITEHKNMNYGKGNADVISVRTLLSASPYLPSYEDVARTDRHFTSRIIEPFKRDMNALDETLTWEFCHKGGEALTDAEKAFIPYEVFRDINIRVHWRDYPDQTARLEAKAKKKAGRKYKKKSVE